ncbi:hypothetical protein D3C83_34800 [compost metagenome]
MYGTWTIRVPVSPLSSSIDRCEVLPLPGEPWVSLPGFAFAYAISSLTLLTGSALFTTSMLGTSATRLMGAKSRTASQASPG